jgi:CBS domain-containing protein
MNKTDIKQIILEEIEAALEEMNMSPEIMAADSRPEEDDFAFDKMDGEMYDDAGDPMEEMARTANIFKLSQEASLKDVLQFMQRVNDVLKTYKSPGQKRPKKRFTPEEMKALATAMLKPEGFTSKDVIAATSYTSPAQANKFLAALEQKGLITITSVLKKSLTPDRDPNAPETRGRKARGSEFDVADDPTGMDFSDFEDLDLSDPLAEERLNEALNKDLTDFGNDVEKFLKEKEIAVKKGKGDPKSFYGPIGDDPKKGGLVLGQGDTSLYIILNGDNVDLLNDVISRFNLKTLTKKENEGDLYIQDKPQIRGKAFEIEVRRFDPSTIKENTNTMSELEKYIKKVINEAKNPLAQKMKEIENQGRKAALETKLAAIQEMIDETNDRLTRIDEDNEFNEMMDKKKVKEVRKQLKELEKAQTKLQKEYGKMKNSMPKNYDEDDKKVMDEEVPVEEDAIDNVVDEVELEEDDLRFEGLNGVHDLKPMTTMNESTLRMQKLAGLITEGDIKKKLSLNEKYENNEDLVSTDEVLKVLKPVVVKLGNTPLGQVLQYFMGNLKSPETSVKDGYDNGGSRLQSMLTKLKDEDYEASQQFHREIKAAFDVAADIKK